MPITDLERRTIANLAIPRNVTDLYTRLVADEHTQVGPAVSQRVLEKGQGLKNEAAVDEYLREHLQPAGYVVKVHPTDDMAKLAAHPPKHNHGWHEESQAIFAERLAAPSRRWRVAGDMWILSDAGLEVIKEPAVESPDLTLERLQAVIDAEWERVKAGTLHEATWKVWLASTLAHYKEEREHLRLPVAGGASGWSNAFELVILDQENQKTQAPALVTPWFMALSILAFNDTDTGTTADDGSHIPTYTGYARDAVPAADMTAAASGSSNNSVAITFAACTGGTSTILAFANCGAVTGNTAGGLRKWGDCASTVISTTQTPATFNTGAYVTTAD